MTSTNLKIGVLGAGTMGSGIAQVSVQAGFDTLVYDVSAELIDRGLAKIRGFIEKSRERGKISPAEEKEILGRLKSSPKLEEFRQCALVIEAAPENLELKRRIFAEIDALCEPQVILATNTSSLAVTAIAGAAAHRERVVGMHFFNPPPLMSLIEVIQGEQTSEETLHKTLELARRFGKTPVRVKDTPGFIVNRVARAFYNESLRILGEGSAEVETIDRVIKEAGGFRMGPFELMDLIGIDINFAVTQSLYDSSFHEPRFRPNPIQQRMVLSGNLGRKTGRGFYKYGEK